MKQIIHIAKHKQLLDQRWKIIREIREFFWSQNFQEVEAPVIVRYPGQEAYLSPMKVQVHNEKKEVFQGYLHTSPEFTMKKFLAAGYQNIFFLGKTFRDYESFGGLHNPEFTMIEWYRTEADMFDLMHDIERLLQHLSSNTQQVSVPLVEKISMRELWKQIINIDLDDYLTTRSMRELCQEKGYAVEQDEAYENMFYQIFLNEIEPTLVERGAVIIYSYPVKMAALAKISEHNSNYAERFELYMNGIEIANAFSELTDKQEQRKRFLDEQEQTKKLGKPLIPIDEEFLIAIDQMPKSAGIALGVDRLIQALFGEKYIDKFLPFGAKHLW